MTELENKKLCEKYPFLKMYDWQDNFLGYKYTWQDYLLEGWQKAMCPQIWEDLKTILAKAHYLNDFRFLDIKEKYGKLRFSYSGIGISYEKQLLRWEEKYEEMSLYTCANCGEEVDYMRLSWITYFCKNCAVEICNKQRERGIREVFIKVQDLKAFGEASKEDRKKYWVSFTEEGEEYYVNKSN